MESLLPGAVIGVLGGGQLGRMLALEAKRMGYRVVTLEPSPDSPCGQVADRQIEAEYGDEAALTALATACDVVTYEFENIDARAVAFLEGLGKPVRPGRRVLEITQDRLCEKEFLRGAGLAVTEFQAVDSLEQLQAAAVQIGFPAVLKTSLGGYDGKGQAVVGDVEEAEAAFRKLRGHSPLIWEHKVAFSKELSVIACRGVDGKSVCYPATENTHKENILDMTVAPARIPMEAAAKALALAEAVGAGLDIVGVYCVELFWTEGGSMLINEIAPRPHNSGHYTLDACVCSQFEQQVRAVCGLPLGSTALLKCATMINIIGDGTGDILSGVEDVLREENLSLHLYGKTGARLKRKMGHFTVLGNTVEETREKAVKMRARLSWR